MKVGIGYFGWYFVFFWVWVLFFLFVRGRIIWGIIYVNVIVLEFWIIRFGSYCIFEGVCDYGFIGGDFMKCLVFGCLI